MLRFLSERRAWAVAALVALMIGTGLWVWGVPYATMRAARAIGDRLGAAAHIEEGRFSIGSIELSGVELRGQHGGFVARIDTVDVDVGLLAALFRASDAVRGVSAHGIEVEVDLSDPGAADSIAAVREKLARRGNASARPARDSSHGMGRRYTVSELTVRVVDAEGALVAISDVSFQKEAHDLRCTAADTLVGRLDRDHAHIGPSKLELRRYDGAWTLSRLEIEHGNLRSLRNGDADARPLALRVRDALTLLRGPTTAPEPPVAPEAEPSQTEIDASVATPLVPSAAPPAPARLFARLSPDAEIEVSGVEIESRTSADGGVERISDLRVQVSGRDNGWYRVVVGGETSNEGTLEADLSLMPAEARAEGNIDLRRISLTLIAPFIPELPLYNTEVGTVNAELELEADSTSRVAIVGGFQINELALASDRIAAKPIEDINFSVRGKGAWLPEARRLEIEQAQIQMNEARVLVAGELERTTDHYRVDLTAKLPPTDCNDVVGAIPDDVLGSLSRFEWSGNWAGVARISLDSRDLEATELSIKIRNLCLFERTPRWVRIERFREPFRHRAVEPDETVFEMLTGPGTDNWVAFEDISPFMVPAVISHEDGGFYDHGGFAPWAIRDAFVRNLEEGRYVVGASTISMQLAKNLYLHREKTLARKVQEVILTWWLENALAKDEILELYLNVIEYGPSVYGLQQAAAYYFGRAPIELSPAESAYLACMLPSPKRYHVSYERGALTRSMKGRVRRLLEHMAKRERIGPEALAYGLAELEDFRFHREGDPPPRSRVLPPLGAPEEPDLELDPFEALFMAP